MPADTAYLSGGPCDGKTQKITAAESDSATITCGGGVYQNLSGKTRPNGDIIFTYQGKVPPSGGGSQNIHAPQAHNGWHALRKAVNQHGPAALTYSQHLGEVSLRQLSRMRKVKL